MKFLRILLLAPFIALIACARFDARSLYLGYLLNNGLYASVQTGTATSSGSGIVTVSIQQIDMSKSFLIFQTRSNLPRPVVSEIRGRIASASSLEFERVTNEASTVTIRYYVITYASGVAVQRGSTVLDAIAKNVSITPVASVAQAFVLHSKTPGAGDNIWDTNDPFIGELTAADNLQFRISSAPSHTVWWEVVEFTDPLMINVQKGSSSLTGLTLTTTSNLASSVDLTKSFVLSSFITNGIGNPDIGSNLIQAQFGGANSVIMTRDISGTPDNLAEVFFQAVKLNDGSIVQSGSVHFNLGELQKTVSINEVDVTRSAAFASVQSGGGQNMGKSPYNADDYVGVATATFNLSAASISIERDCSLDAADIAWYVVRFGK